MKVSLMLLVILGIGCKTTGVCLEEESLSSNSSMAVTELQSGCRSLKVGRLLWRVTKQYRWGGGKEFTILCCLHSFRIGTVRSQK